MNLKLRFVALLLVVVMCLAACDIFVSNSENQTTTSTTVTTKKTTNTTTTKSTTTKSSTTKTTTTKVTTPKLPVNEFDPASNSVSYDELVSRYDLTTEEVDATSALLDEMLTLAMDPNANLDEIEELFDEYDAKFTHIVQQATISMIIYYYNMVDEVASERYLAAMDIVYGLEDEYNQMLKTMYLESPHSAELFEGWTEEELKSLEEYDPTVMQLQKDIDALQVQYDQLTGKEANYNDLCVDIYKQLIIKGNQLARLNKYDNYYDYASDNIYERDYEREDLAAFREYIVEYVVPYALSLLAEYRAHAGWTSSTKKLRVEEFLDKEFYLSPNRNYVSAYLNSLGDTTMGNGMRHVFENRNCMFSFSEKSHPTAFQTYLYEDDNPFCFFGSKGQSANTVIHEIGHYYAAITNGDLDNYDLCETHSQGNEFLFLTFAETYMSEDVYGAVEAYNLVNACFTIIIATIVDEFEQRLYVLDDETINNMTTEDFDNVMASVCEAYGGTSWVNKLTNPYSYWRAVCISSPVYYISYAVSASAAINIYALAQEDYDAAILAYTTLVEGVTEADGFLGALEKAGLTTPFDEETFISIEGVLAN